MAKKKTYRRRPVYTPKKPVKKPPMPRNTKIALMVAAGVVLLAVIVFFAIYSDGSLPVRKELVGEGATATTKNVVVVPENESWLIINQGTISRPKYHKLGTMAAPDGYTLDNEWGSGSDENVKQYHWVPADETSPISYVHVQGVNRKPEDIAAEALDSYGKFYAESTNSEIMTTDIHGIPATYFASRFGAEDENGVTKYHQSLTMYLPAVHDSSVLINVMAPMTSMTAGMDDNEMLNYAHDMTHWITLEPR